MRAPPIEVRAKRGAMLGMPPSNFLRDYWQKKPLLIRGAFASAEWMKPNDLAGLACEELALSRIVQHDAKRDRWKVRNGPFAESDFAKLGNRDWTLLVQDVDKWDVDVAAILPHFNFVPSWRVDDVMISYAEEGGGVGAHVDHYDVFLIQGLGQRRWRIDDRKNAPTTFRDDVELKLLKHFDPTHEWILDAGDMLYLPPGVPHQGVAIGDCMTYSVGMRAPSQAELLIDFAESVAEPLGEEARLVDPDLSPSTNADEITPDSIGRVRAALPWLGAVDDAQFTDWFGRYITRYRAAHEAAPGSRPITTKRLAEKLATHSVARNPWSRIAWARSRSRATLFVAGDSFPCSIAAAKLIAGSRKIDGRDLLKHASSFPLFAELINRGHWTLIR
ncbi:MAG TPA: cupin domain-containing protein [Rudaea sp.]|nr:cupin domain-containing protein [Rudaea sp.]